MKKIILILGMLFIGYNGQSQVLISILLGDKLNSPNLEFGLEGGWNYSNITGMDSDNYKPSFNLGFYFDILVKDHWWLDTGVLVKSDLGFGRLTDVDLTNLGVEIHPEEGKYEQVLETFLVPIQMKYRFDNRLYLEGGIQLSWTRKGYVEFNGKKIVGFDGGENEQEITIREDNSNDINRINLGPIAGVGYKLKETGGMTVGMKYYYSVLDVYKHIDNTHDSAFFLKVNIPIGAGKKKEKINEEPEEELEEKDLQEEKE